MSSGTADRSIQRQSRQLGKQNGNQEVPPTPSAPSERTALEDPKTGASKYVGGGEYSSEDETFMSPLPHGCQGKENMSLSLHGWRVFRSLASCKVQDVVEPAERGGLTTDVSPQAKEVQGVGHGTSWWCFLSTMCWQRSQDLSSGP